MSADNIRKVLKGLKPEILLEFKDGNVTVVPKEKPKLMDIMRNNCLMDKDKVVDMYKLGMTYTAIGAHFNISKQSVHQFIRLLKRNNEL